MLIAVALMAVACACYCLQLRLVRERHAVFQMLEARGGLWNSSPNEMYAGPTPSLIDSYFENVPPQRYIFLAQDEDFTKSEIDRIRRAFPEATVSVSEQCGRNAAEPWPTAEQIKRYAANLAGH